MQESTGLNETPYWILTLIVCAIDIVWIAAGGWSIPLRGLWGDIGLVGFFLAFLIFRRFRQEPQFSVTVRSLAVVAAYSNATVILSYLMVSIDAPLIDHTLFAWDHALGFDWGALTTWVYAHAVVRAVLHFAYLSLIPQFVFVVFFLGFSARFLELRTLLAVMMITSLVTIVSSGLFPASGPWNFYAEWAQAGSELTSQFVPLRDGTLRTIDLQNLQGLIAFPSFHTALAVLLIVAMWRTALAYPFLILNVAMIVSTPTEGGHYLVDVLAGAVLVLVALVGRSVFIARLEGASPARCAH